MFMLRSTHDRILTEKQDELNRVRQINTDLGVTNGELRRTIDSNSKTYKKTEELLLQKTDEIQQLCVDKAKLADNVKQLTSDNAQLASSKALLVGDKEALQNEINKLQNEATSLKNRIIALSTKATEEKATPEAKPVSKTKTAAKKKTPAMKPAKPNTAKAPTK